MSIRVRCRSAIVDKARIHLRTAVTGRVFYHTAYRASRLSSSSVYRVYSGDDSAAMIFHGLLL